MDVTHNTNCSHWKLSKIIVRYEYENWITKTDKLYKLEDRDIISAVLTNL